MVHRLVCKRMGFPFRMCNGMLQKGWKQVKSEPLITGRSGTCLSYTKKAERHMELCLSEASVAYIESSKPPRTKNN